MDLKQFGELNYLSINNLRAIELVEMKLEGKNFVPLYGPNGSGKSTVLDALMMLFKGGTIPDQIIKDGGKLATIKAETTTGIKIEKRIKLKKNGEQTSELVMSSENKLISSPQKILKELFGSFITPNKIAESTGVAIFKKITDKLDISFESLDNNIAAIKANISNENAILKINPEIEKPDGDKPSIIKYSREEHIKCSERHQELKDHVALRDSSTHRLEIISKQLAELQEEHDTLERKVVARTNEILKEQEEQKSLILKLKDFETILNNQELTENWNNYTKRKNLREERIKTLSELKESLKKAEREKVLTLTNVDTGVKGLTLSESKDVLFNGLPWENTCFSDKMKVAATLGIKNNPKDKLPIMFIEHGESLSDIKRQEIAKEAINQGAIVFIEVFMENTEGVEDGVVLSLPEKHYIPTEAKESETSQLEIFPQTQEPIEIEIVKTKEEKEDILKTLGLTKVDNIETGDELWD